MDIFCNGTSRCCQRSSHRWPRCVAIRRTYVNMIVDAHTSAIRDRCPNCDTFASWEGILLLFATCRCGLNELELNKCYYFLRYKVKMSQVLDYYSILGIFVFFYTRTRPNNTGLSKGLSGLVTINLFFVVTFPYHLILDRWSL